MDFLRAAAKGLLYDFPLDCASYLYGGKLNPRQFFDTFTEVLRHTTHNFTTSEIHQIVDLTKKEWMRLEDGSIEMSNVIKGIMNVLALCGEEFVDIKGWSPRVKFEQLLRWRELSKYLGEDSLVSAVLAQNHIDRDFKQSHTITKMADLNWPDVLDHDNAQINEVLDKGLSDTHAHLNASTAIFDFNWIVMMNSPHQIMLSKESGIFDEEKENLNYSQIATKYNDNRIKHTPFGVGFSMDYDPLTYPISRNFTLRQWCIIASILRLRLFCRILQIPKISSLKVNLKNLLDSVIKLEKCADIVICDIASLKRSAVPLIGNSPLDYAITHEVIEIKLSSASKSPYFYHSGERYLLYRALRSALDNKVNRESLFDLFIYLLIKNKVRRQFVQTNSLIGFENFKRYQDNKNLFGFNKEDKQEGTPDNGITLSLIKDIYAIKSAMSGNDCLETRIMVGREGDIPELEKALNTDFRKCSTETQIKAELESERQSDQYSEKRLSYVLHFSKAISNNKDITKAIAQKRDSIWDDIDSLLSFIEKNSEINIVGLDVAGSELACRPEVFAPMFRWAKFYGIRNFTYHAGEDFYDILDGLRTIYELIEFFEYKTGNRIGHALALGTDAKAYYVKRHHTIIIPKQILLDNLVWMEFYSMENNIDLHPRTRLCIDENVSQLIQDIGYEPCSHYEYWQSILLRGAAYGDKAKSKGKKMVEYYSLISSMTIIDKARRIRDQYETGKDIRENGCNPKQIKVGDWFTEDVVRLQCAMLQDIQKRGIVIETNPTSNLCIGNFNRYDELPLFIFQNPDENISGYDIQISINTDDRGVFATNLRNEYSLIAAAMHKMKKSDGNAYSPSQIKEYIGRIAQFGNSTKFTSDGFKVYR